jgi:replicative DNA helicase
MKRYTYDADFQVKVLALSARDPVFLPTFREVICESYFDHPVCKELSVLVQSYLDDKGSPPSMTVLRAMASEHCEGVKASDTYRSDMLNIVADIYSVDLSDAEFIRERVVMFGRRQAVKEHVIRMATLVERGDDEFDAEVERLKKSLLLGSGIQSQGLAFHEDQLLFKLPKMARDSGLYDRSRKTPTGFPTLDDALFGGLGPGEIGVVLGYTGRGKSIVLCNLAAEAITHDKPVVFYTFELQEIDVALRMASRLSGMPIDVIRRGEYEYYYHIKEVAEKNPFFIVKYFAPKTVGVNTLRSHLSKMTSTGHQVTPELVVVDYADKLKGGKRFDNTYGEMGEVYEGLIALGHDFKAPIWTASQVQRNARSEHPGYHMDLDVVADSFRKVADADVVLTMNQTTPEHQNKLMRLYTAKMRRGADGVSIPCTIDYQIMTVKEVRGDTELSSGGDRKQCNNWGG